MTHGMGLEDLMTFYHQSKAVWNEGCREIRSLLRGSSQDLDTWLVTTIYKAVYGHLEGVPQPGLTITMVINHLQVMG